MTGGGGGNILFRLNFGVILGGSSYYMHKMVRGWGGGGAIYCSDLILVGSS